MTSQQKIKSWGYTIRGYTKDLAPYLGREWDEPWYMHILRGLKGESDLTEEERSAMEAFEADMEKPCVSGAKYYRLKQKKASVDLLLRYAKTGIFNATHAQNIIRSLINIL